MTALCSLSDLAVCPPFFRSGMGDVHYIPWSVQRPAATSLQLQVPLLMNGYSLPLAVFVFCSIREPGRIASRPTSHKKPKNVQPDNFRQERILSGQWVSLPEPLTPSFLYQMIFLPCSLTSKALSFRLSALFLVKTELTCCNC